MTTNNPTNTTVMTFRLPRLRHRILLPLTTAIGALNTLAFAPFNLWPIQLLTLALLVWYLMRTDSVKSGALLGWSYSFGWMLCGSWWLYISLHNYGDMAAWIAVLSIVLMGIVVALYAGLATGLTVWLRQRWSASPPLLTLVIFPSLWGLSEWLRGWVLTGVPWLISGYAHTASPLAGYAPLFGVYGIGILAAYAAGCLALLPQRILPGTTCSLILLAGFYLHNINWTTPHGNPISVRLLQANVPQDIKFAESQISASLQLHYDMLTASPADLIVTSETALPLLQTQLPPTYLPALSDFVQQTGSHLALGIVYTDGPKHYTNSMIGLTPQTANSHPQFRYDKHHLMPFGEFIPFGFRWFTDLVSIPLTDLHRGAKIQPPFAVKDQWILPNICYEDLFGEEIAAQLTATTQPAATMLLNISNLGWFGNTIALSQHLQVSQMRALETGRPMLRATNTGSTAVIDPHGRVITQLAHLTRDTLAASVQGYSGTTPYILLGNYSPVSIAILMLAGAWLRTRKQRSNQPAIPCNSHKANKTR